MTDLVHSQATEFLARTAALAPTLLAVMLGAAHDAAHDSRHTLAFPCH